MAELAIVVIIGFIVAVAILYGAVRWLIGGIISLANWGRYGQRPHIDKAAALIILSSVVAFLVLAYLTFWLNAIDHLTYFVIGAVITLFTVFALGNTEWGWVDHKALMAQERRRIQKEMDEMYGPLDN